MDERSSRPLWNRKCIYHVSWTRFDEAVQDIVEQIWQAHYDPQIVVCILRGGLILGAKLAYALDISELHFLSIQRNTTSDIFPERHAPHVMSPASIIPAGANILLVDDIVGSGETLASALTLLKAYQPGDIRTASLALNTNGLSNRASSGLDYVAFSVDDWVVFPWENQKQITFHNLPLVEV